MTKPLVPAAAFDRHVVIFGMTGAGKTSVTKSAIVEPDLEAERRVGIITPKDDWWGLRLSKSGKRKGFDIPIFGGQHEDYPLTVKDAALLAETYGTSKGSAVFCTSKLSVQDRAQWFAKFAETLLMKNRGWFRLVIDEAHIFMPKQGGRGQGGMVPMALHNGNELVSQGRSLGLRIVLASQRPAKLHNDASTQCSAMIAMRVMHPADRKAILDWVEEQGDPAQAKDILSSLAKQRAGQGWVWAPSVDMLDQIQFPRPNTYDSSAAPDDDSEDGPTLPPVNLDALKGKLAKIEAAKKASDPKALTAEIARLNAELAKIVKQSNSATIVDPAKITKAEKSGYDRGIADTKKAANDEATQKVAEVLTQTKAILSTALSAFDALILKVGKPVKIAAPKFSPALAVPTVQFPAQTIIKPTAPAKPISTDGETVTPIVRKIIDEIHRAYPMALSFEAAAMRAAVSRRSSAYNKYRQQVETSAELERRGDGRFQSAPGIARPVDTGGDPIEAFAQRLPPAYAKMLRAIAAAPAAMNKDEIAAASGVSPTSSGLTSGIRELMALALIEKHDGDVYAINGELR